MTPETEAALHAERAAIEAQIAFNRREIPSEAREFLEKADKIRLTGSSAASAGA